MTWQKLQTGLSEKGYVASDDLAMALFLAVTLEKPLLLEGPAGVGKTQIAKTLAEVQGARLIRLQCYEGLDASHAIYEWNYQRQLLSIRAAAEEHRPANEIEEHIFSEKFLLQTLRLGGAGTISAMANVIPGHLRRLYDGWLNEDAEELQEEANVMREYVRTYAPIPAIKAIIGQRAGDPVWRTVRPPLVAMDDAAAQELFSAMGVASGVA